MSPRTELKANMGIVLRGDVIALKGFVERLDELIAEAPDMQLVHKHISASKLWIREGEGMNEGDGDERRY